MVSDDAAPQLSDSDDESDVEVICVDSDSSCYEGPLVVDSDGSDDEIVSAGPTDMHVASCAGSSALRPFRTSPRRAQRSCDDEGSSYCGRYLAPLYPALGGEDSNGALSHFSGGRGWAWRVLVKL